MVDTPKTTIDDDKQNPVENKPPKTQQKHWRPRRRSKSRRSKDSNVGTGENNTPDDAENNADLAEVISE